METAPDSWWGTDLIDLPIDDESEARQVFLYQLQQHPETCPDVLSERVLMTRDPDHIRPILGGSRGISVALIPFSADEADCLDGMRRIDPEYAADVINRLGKPFRKALAKQLGNEEDCARQEAAMEACADGNGQFPDEYSRLFAEDIVNGLRVSQAEALSAMLLGEL